MFHLLKFQSECHHNLDYHSYIVLNSDVYDTFVRLGGKSKRFQVDYHHARFDNAITLSSSSEEERSFLNDSELYLSMLSWIEEYEPQYYEVTIVKYYHCPECTEECQVLDSDNNISEIVFLTRKQYLVFKERSQSCAFAPSNDGLRCDKEHRVWVLWSQESTSDVTTRDQQEYDYYDSNNNELSRMILDWINSWMK